jgi:hypothetical protein
MTQQQRAPEPKGNDWQAWGRRLMLFLGQTRSSLVQQTGDETAAEDGIMMWDRENGYPVVSKDGEWRQIVLADGYAFLGQDADITAAAADTAYAITYDAPPMADGISLGTPASRIVFEEGGTYLLAFSAQITSTSGSTVAFRFWPRINGVDVSGSTMVANLHQNNATTVISRTAIFQVSAGDYLEAMWATDSTSGYLHATAATAYAPAAPSTSLSITRIRA